MHKIREKRGETLVESLVSILIFTFASILMLTMISAGAEINRTAREADRTYFSQLLTAEMAEGPGTEKGTVLFTVNGAAEAVTVDVYREDSGLYSYFAAEEDTE